MKVENVIDEILHTIEYSVVGEKKIEKKTVIIRNVEDRCGEVEIQMGDQKMFVSATALTKAVENAMND